MHTSDLSVSKCFLFQDQFFLQSSLLSSRFYISEMDVLQFESLSINLLLKFINTSVKRFHCVFPLHEFRSRFSKQMISVSIKKRLRNICRVRESDERFITPKILLMSSGKFVSIGKCVLLQPVLD